MGNNIKKMLVPEVTDNMPLIQNTWLEKLLIHLSSKRKIILLFLLIFFFQIMVESSSIQHILIERNSDLSKLIVVINRTTLDFFTYYSCRF